VPSVFTRSGQDDDIEIVWAPILDLQAQTIRYRKDTIESALKCDEVEIDAAQQTALQQLEDVLATLSPVSYHLAPGDALLVNNLKLLHARTSFDNPERFLYRVRMKEPTS